MLSEGFVKMAKKLHGDDNEVAIAIAEEIGNECANITHEDRCELAVLLMECANKVFGKHNENSADRK